MAWVLPVPLRASMEPLPKERSDLDLVRQPASRSGLNGAAPEGAERLDPPHATIARNVASMEPLPKERSDVALVDPSARSSSASMEPLPKERSDVPIAVSGSAGRCRLNGAAPEGAERR